MAVLHANRVLACSPAARAEGVRRGLRKREAQGRCPQLTVVEHDPGRDARAFEPVVAAVEELAPGVEVIRPGACAVAARGPAGYFGGEAAAAERLVEQIALACGGGGPGRHRRRHLRRPARGPGRADRAGRGTPASSWPGWTSSTLDRPDLVDLLRRLGIRTLADFAALPAGDVLARFGFDAAYAHRLAAGVDERPLAVRQPPPDLDVTGEYDPPLERVDMAAFAARALAERLHERLAGHGLAATRLGIEAHTAAGEELHRVWRHDGLLDAAALADRVRWQLDGWLTGTGRASALSGRLPARPDRGHRPAAARPRRAWSGTPACSPACGASWAWPTSGRTGRWSGCRACSARSRSSPPCSAAGAATPTGSAWCPGATSGAPARPAATERTAGSGRRGRGGCPPRHRRPCCPSRPRSRSAPPTAHSLAVDARLALTGAPATVGDRPGAAGRGDRLGRAVAGGGALVGAGGGEPAGPVPARPGRRAGAAGAPAGGGAWRLEAIYD